MKRQKVKQMRLQVYKACDELQASAKTSSELQELELTGHILSSMASISELEKRLHASEMRETPEASWESRELCAELEAEMVEAVESERLMKLQELAYQQSDLKEELFEVQEELWHRKVSNEFLEDAKILMEKAMSSISSRKAKLLAEELHSDLSSENAILLRRFLDQAKNGVGRLLLPVLDALSRAQWLSWCSEIEANTWRSLGQSLREAARVQSYMPRRPLNSYEPLCVLPSFGACRQQEDLEAHVNALSEALHLSMAETKEKELEIQAYERRLANEVYPQAPLDQWRKELFKTCSLLSEGLADDWEAGLEVQVMILAKELELATQRSALLLEAWFNGLMEAR